MRISPTHQVLPCDNWDQECTFEMMIVNPPVNPDAGAGMLSINPDARRGPRKTLTGIRCKTGIAWSFEGGPIAALSAGMTPEADTTSGANAVYVFALPQ